VGSLVALGDCVIGGQVTLHTLGASLYPAEVRATGVCLALAVGRIGGLSGPMIGGFVLGVPGLRDAVFLVLGGIIAAPCCAMIILGRVTRNDAVEEFL